MTNNISILIIQYIRVKHKIRNYKIFSCSPERRRRAVSGISVVRIDLRTAPDNIHATAYLSFYHSRIGEAPSHPPLANSSKFQRGYNPHIRKRGRGGQRDRGAHINARERSYFVVV